MSLTSPEMQTLDSPSRVAIITGAAQGIGRAIALKLAEDGLNVAISDLPSQSSLLASLASEITSKGRQVIAITADVSSELDVTHLVEETVEKLGSLDVMIANAGIAVLGSIVDTDIAEYERVFSINVKGVLLCYQAAAKVMIKQNRGGRIIGASSLGGKKGAAFCGVYCASKFAVRAFTQVTACELGKYGITVNGYAPGFTQTAMVETMDARIGELLQAGPGIFLEGAKAQAALGRLADASEIANLVSFLASHASSFITGQTITIDGGTHFD